MTPIQPPPQEFEGVSYVQFPVNFFARKDLRGLFKTWGGNATNWLMSVMIAVRESKSRDRLEISGQAITREDVDLIQCWPAIEPAWVQDCIDLGLMAEDNDGCLIILCRKQFVLYRDETAFAIAKAKQRAAKDSSNGQVGDKPATSERQTGDKDLTRAPIQSNPIQSNPSTIQSNINPIQSNPTRPQSLEDSGRTDFSDGSEDSRVDDSGGTPPEPPLTPLGNRPSPKNPPTMDQAAALFSGALQAVESGKPRALEVNWWLELQSEAATQAEAQEPDPLDLFDAVVYATDATRWAKNSGAEKIKQPRKYLFECAKRALFDAFDRNRDRRASYRDGFRDPGPLQWREPEGRASP